MNILDAWLKDLPQQFRGLPNIEILITAFARQLQELEQVFLDLNEKTDLESAAGQNLDYVGTIIPLTRKEAGILSGMGNSEEVLSDERYRQLLKYQRLLNTNDCTYYDLIAGLQLLWNTGTLPIYYYEDRTMPATIILGAEIRSKDKADITQSVIPHPAGVGFKFRLAMITNLPAVYVGIGVRMQTCQRIRTNIAIPAAMNVPELYAGLGVRIQICQHVRTNVAIPTVMNAPALYAGLGVRIQTCQHVRAVMADYTHGTTWGELLSGGVPWEETLDREIIWEELLKKGE